MDLVCALRSTQFESEDKTRVIPSPSEGGGWARTRPSGLDDVGGGGRAAAGRGHGEDPSHHRAEPALQRFSSSLSSWPSIQARSSSVTLSVRRSGLPASPCRLASGPPAGHRLAT